MGSSHTVISISACCFGVAVGYITYRTLVRITKRRATERRVREIAYERARSLGLAEDHATFLADSVVDGLVVKDISDFGR